ncbi:polysaccharide deacetylase family protein [Spirillospora sp. NPDC029432]|uniref:polysaccharide deacetylase family protein n=1 Tax=Spirillospora sp. NPDC029432 TaxID=3154599 RepID=UPI0034543D25
MLGWLHRRGGVAVALLLAVSGCTAREHRQPAPVTDVTEVRAVDPGRVPGIMPVTRVDERRRAFAAYPSVAGARPLDDALARAVDEWFRLHEERRGVHELNVEWSLTAFSDRVIGVRLVAEHGDTGGGGAEHGGTEHGGTGRGGAGEREGTERRTFWYDRDAGAVRAPGDLVDEARLAELVRQEAQTGRAGHAAPGGFPSLAFNDQGDLVAEFGSEAVAIGYRAYEPLLTPFGHRARDAALTVRPVPRRDAVPRTLVAPVDCRTAKCVALTFDDGPGPETGRLLDILAGHGARATFFVVGGNAAALPATLRRQRAAGHVIGNHTHAHRDLTRLPALRVSSEIQRTQRAIKAATGEGATLLRAPYGAVNGTVTAVARSLGLAHVGWNAAPEGGGDIAAEAVAGARPGGVVRLRDVDRESVDAVPEILARLAADGYTFVTVPELRAAGTVPR